MKKVITIICVAVVLAGAVFGVYKYNSVKDTPTDKPTPPSTSSEESNSSEENTSSIAEAPVKPTYTASFVEASNPKNWAVNWGIIKNGGIVNSYSRPEKITFGDSSEYTKMEGIVTFRGDNYRTGATYGKTTIKDETLTEKWTSSISALKWTGCGWTGQPLVVRWDEETKNVMNMYDEKKQKKDLVEAIYATLDGHIYFYDLEDGSYTRDPLFIGMNFKGAGALDPRGYPLMYVGSGVYYEGKAPRMYVISLIDGSILYEQSGKDSFITRSGGWCAFDGCPLVDAETDTLIWPGESGILYTIKLNTNYDKTAGTISVAPENVVKARYTTNTGRTVGYECSAVAVGEYIYIADNGGMFFCVDINTMELKWAQNLRDDVNSTPVFECDENGKGYLYAATSMEYGGGKSYIYKLDAATGEIIWERSYDRILYNKDVSGGILASPVLGKKGTELEGMIIYPVGKTHSSDVGTLVALNTKTGETVWEKKMGSYTWSSPTAVYAQNGKAYIVMCTALGGMYLIDSTTGETLSNVTLGGTVEASPVVFENMVIVGTRAQKVFGIEIS